MGQYKSAALENAEVVTIGPANLSWLFVTNTGPAQFVSLADAAAISADGAVTPVFSIYVATLESKSIDFGNWRFTNGVVIYNSTAATPFTKTIGAADCMFAVRWG